MMSIGQMIKEYLEEVGIPQNKFAISLKIKPPKLNLMLQGHRKIQVEEYALMCLELGVPLEKFITAPQKKGA